MILILSGTDIALAQQTFPDDKIILKKYLTQYPVTKLEWELLQLNISWIGSYSGEEYLTSFPIYFDYKNNVFKTTFRVLERRDSKDTSFFSLSRPKRESIMNGAIEYLKEMLSMSFPEIKTHPSLLIVEFKYRANEGSSNVAVYKNGKLLINE